MKTFKTFVCFLIMCVGFNQFIALAQDSTISFQPPTDFPLNAIGPTLIKALNEDGSLIDWDGDGNPNFVVTGYKSYDYDGYSYYPFIKIFERQPDGLVTQESALPLGTHERASDLAVANFPQSAKPVLVMTGGAPNSRAIRFAKFSSTGTPQWGASIVLPVGSYSGRLAIADFDSNGNNDIAVRVSVSGANKISLFLNVNVDTGAFSSSIDLAGSSDASLISSLVAVDINNDSLPDLVVTRRNDNYTTGKISVYMNLSGGNFANPVDYNLTDQVFYKAPIELKVADINGDNYPDLIFTRKSINRIYALMNQGSGSFDTNPTSILGVSYYPSDLEIVDLDQDGRNDIVVSNSGNGFWPPSISVLQNRGNGAFVNVGNLDFTQSTSSPTSMEVADLDRDGRSDLLTANKVSDDVSIFMNSGNFRFDTNVIGSGSITRTPDQPTYQQDQIVQLTAVPGECHRFSRWSGDLTGTANPANITMDANKTVTAEFARLRTCSDPPINAAVPLAQVETM